jgi:hypothetical protein
MLHLAQTRTEPPFLTPLMDWLAPWLPAPAYQGVPVHAPPPVHH